ncbi:MAG: protein kinase [Chthoniobacterales bacterium]
MNSTDRAERVARIVEEALERSPDEWPAYLEEACDADPALRAEAESLLGHQNRAVAFLEAPAYHAQAATLLADETAALLPGEMLDGYKILSLLEEGGMGEVYLAEDAALGRVVALKLVKQGLGRAHLIQQFRQEERILAALNHPHIARLYGAGVSERGVPYFVMEYVDGERLEEFCTLRYLTIRERLDLFRKLCSAVAYAHQRLVIHRDLKPGNIRVTPEGEPKLLDFGIARLLDDETAAPTDPTAAGVAGMMTPDYASPEQIRGETMTTASDVYSLGVILYELLTGEKPYRLTNQKPEEIARAITETVPTRPSAVKVFDQRSLRGDLDHIVLKAMNKESAARYLSAAELSDDIHRHLTGRPVHAGPDRWSYRSGKFIRRHKLTVAAAAVVLGTLLGGIFATSREARRADRQRARAERRFNDVRQLANSLMFDLHDAIEDLPGSTPARVLIVKEAIKYLDSLAQEAHDDPSLQRELVAAYIRVGNVQGNPNNANLGDTAGALRSYTQAQKIAEQLLAAHPADAAARRSLAVAKEKMGDLLTSTGDMAGAVASTRASLDIFRSIAQAAPASLPAQQSLAISQIKMGDVLGNPNFPNAGDETGAMENYRASLAILRALDQSDPGNLKTRRFLGLVHERIGAVLETMKDTAAARESYQESQRIRQELAAAHPDNASLLRDAAIAEEKIANMLTAEHDLASALASRMKSLEIFQQLLTVDPTNVQSQLSLAISYIHLADLLAGPEDPNLARRDEGLKNYRQAEEILKTLAAKEPLEARVRNTLDEVEEKLRKVEAAPAP